MNGDGGVGQQGQSLVESEELHIASLAGGQKEEGLSFKTIACCSPTAMDEGTAEDGQKSTHTQWLYKT